MKSKKLIRNVLVMLVALMTTAMVLSSCSNASDSEYANITIRLSGSGSGRAISSEEKNAATFNVYFNDSQVASNVSGTYNGTSQVGTRLNVRVDALVNGKRIARGENTITVMAGTNNVAIKLNENREEEKIPTIGSIIMRDGSYLTKEEITSANQTQAIAVVYKVSGGKAWAVGIRQEQGRRRFCYLCGACVYVLEHIHDFNCIVNYFRVFRKKNSVSTNCKECNLCDALLINIRYNRKIAFGWKNESYAFKNF